MSATETATRAARSARGARDELTGPGPLDTARRKPHATPMRSVTKARYPPLCTRVRVRKPAPPHTAYPVANMASTAAWCGAAVLVAALVRRRLHEQLGPCRGLGG